MPPPLSLNGIPALISLPKVLQPNKSVLIPKYGSNLSKESDFTLQYLASSEPLGLESVGAGSKFGIDWVQLPTIDVYNEVIFWVCCFLYLFTFQMADTFF